MKKNNGGLQLWLWTITPLLCVICAMYDYIRYMRLPGAMTFSLSTATHIFIALTAISPFVRHHLFKSERDSMNADALKRLRYANNVAWRVLAVPIIVAVVCWFVVIISVLIISNGMD